jgi:hypothetical protein
MNTDAFEKLQSLVKMAGTINGRKKFQKMVHILKAKGVDFQESFDFHYYGPYSVDLQLEIDEMTSQGLLNEQKYNSTFIYEVNSGDDDIDVSDDTLSSRAGLIRYLNDQAPQVLELVSTFYYLKDHGYQDMDKIVKKAEMLKTHLKSRIQEARDVFCAIEEIKTPAETVS